MYKYAIILYMSKEDTLENYKFTSILLKIIKLFFVKIGCFHHICSIKQDIEL